MRKLNFIGFLVSLALFLQSCKEVIETNISEKMPVLILPQSMDTVDFNPVHFKWEAMTGATKYHLQIVKPSFANLQQYILDSIIVGTDFYLSMDSSQYELKLTAMNGAYNSKTLSNITFWVSGETSSGPGNVAVPLIAPNANSYVNGDFEGNFTWGAISGGTNYEFRLVKGTSFVDGTLIYSTTPSNSFEADLPTANLPLLPGHYFWGVKAFIGSAEQLYSTQDFYVDTTTPNLAILDLPMAAATISAGTISFSWHFNATQETFSSPVSSFIEIATDQNFTQQSIVESYTGNVYQHDFTLTANSYYWRVRNSDGAGNMSPYSEVRNLILN
jgi:hypothetical protein